MTGSGKTGLAIALLEELAGAGVPIIAIDPKGDLPNLALLFPNLRPSSFLPWIDPAEAKRDNSSLEDYAAKTAQKWREGLASWGLGSDDIARLKSTTDIRIFTPGSSLGRPVNVLGNFQAPPPEVQGEVQADLAQGIVTGLLSLIDKEIDALQDPRHTLLTTILEYAWGQRTAPSLEDLITYVVDPPFPKVGVFPVDRYITPDDRMKLALKLNTLVASSGFAAWRSGQALNIEELTQLSENRTPINIFYLAHLSENERRFFVGRLMTELLSWSRTLSGSSSLRTLVYFDEVSGYLPPYPANPASKAPILSLLKQARAVGVGLCLATQNPVDLDYKALSNTGTLMIGRLQTQQDRDRVRDGLLSAAGNLSAVELEKEFSKIATRKFLVRTPLSLRPITLSTRHTLSFLRGPITLKELVQIPQRATPSRNPTEVGSQVPIPLGTTPGERLTPPPAPKGFGQGFLDPRFTFGTHHNGYFSPWRQPTRSDNKIAFWPGIRARVSFSFQDSKENFLIDQTRHYLAFPLVDARDISSFHEIALETDAILATAPTSSVFTDLPDTFDEEEELAAARCQLIDHFYRTITATRYIHKEFKLYSKPQEAEADFLIRCQNASDSCRDEAAQKIHDKVQSQLNRLGTQMAKAKNKVETLALSAKGKTAESLWQAGSSLLGLFSRRRSSLSSVLSKSRQALEAQTRSGHAEDELDRLQQSIEELQTELQHKLDALEAEYAPKAHQYEATEIRLKKKDIAVDAFEILWVPVTTRL